MDWLPWVVVIVSAIWVGFDAQKLGVRAGSLGGGAVDISATSWFLVVLLLWIVGFPAYLMTRPRYVALAASAGSGEPSSRIRVGMYVDGRALESSPDGTYLTVGDAPVTREQVLGYDSAGQIAWVSQEMRAWLYQAPQGPAPAAPMPNQRPTAAAKSTSVLDRDASQLGWALLIGVLLVCPLAFGISRCQGGQASVATDSSPSPSASTVANAPVLRVGDTARIGKFDVTLISVERRKKVGNQYFEKKPAEGGEFIAVRWKYKNVSDKPASRLSCPSLTLMNPAETDFEADVAASSAYSTEAKISEKIVSDLNPGITVQGAEVYEVAKGSFNDGTWRLKALTFTDSAVFRLD